MTELYAFTKKGFQELCMALNHNTTQMKADIKWLKLLTIGILGLLTKIAFF